MPNLVWDRKMHEIKTQNLKVLYIKTDRGLKREGAMAAGSHQVMSKQKGSPQHMNKKL